MRPAIGRLPVALLVAVVVSACSPTTPTGPTPTPAAASAAPGTALPSSAPSTVVPPGPSSSADPATPLTIDSGLLAFLPAAVAGTPVTEDLDEASKALANPVLPDLATAVDAAVAVDAGNGNLVYALIVRLRPGALAEAAFRQWRDSYDEGACSDAGSTVQGHAEAQIGGRTVFIGTCANGFTTYHVRIEAANLLISAWAFGSARFGEALMAGLRVPA